VQQSTNSVDVIGPNGGGERGMSGGHE
jgi:hypothetical protein